MRRVHDYKQLTTLCSSIRGRICRRLCVKSVRTNAVCITGLGKSNKSLLSLVPRLSTRRYPHWLLNASAGSIDRQLVRDACSYRSSRAHAQQHTAARRCCCRWMGQTDKRTDGRTPDRHIDSAPHTMRAALERVVDNTSSLVADGCGKDLSSHYSEMCR